MPSKVSLLSVLVVGTASLMTWGGFAFHDNYQYNKKMEEYAKLREKFFQEKLGNHDVMCHDFKEECLQEKNTHIQYLPSPYEDALWEELYKSLESNRKQDETKNLPQGKFEPQLKNVRNYQQLKDHCYKEIKTSINEANKNPSNKEYFNLLGDDNAASGLLEKAHKMCVMNVSDLKI